MSTRDLQPFPPPPSPAALSRMALITLALTFACVWLGLFTGKSLMPDGQRNWLVIFWPETGSSIALLIIFGLRMAPAIYLGNILAFICFFPISAYPTFGVDSTLQAMFSAWIMRAFFPKEKTILPSLHFDIVLIGVGGALASLPSAIINCYRWADLLPLTDHFWQNVLIWWLGETVSVVAIAPLILTISMPVGLSAKRRFAEYSLYLAGLVAGAWMVFSFGRRGEPIGPGVLVMTIACALIGLRAGTMAGVITNGLVYIVAAALYTAHAAVSGVAAMPGHIIESYCLLLHLMAVTLLVASGGFHAQRSETELHRISARVLNAQEAERRRLSRDLHDSVCQTIMAAILRLKMLRAADRLDFERDIHPRITELDGTLVELRQNIDGLRPETLDRTDFVEVVRDYCTAYTGRHGIGIDVSAPLPLPTLPMTVREHVFRILQESIANAVFHGGAKQIDVNLREGSKSSFIFSVRDNGCGFAVMGLRTDRPHYGLRTMHERALLMGGELAIESTPGVGSRILLQIPVGANT